MKPLRYPIIGLCAFGWMAMGPASLNAQVPDRAAYEDYALQSNGSVAAGRDLFFSNRQLQCARCHVPREKEESFAPELGYVGDRYTRRELIRAVLEPSAEIAFGYATHIVTMKTGEVLTGIVRFESDESMELLGAEGGAHPVVIARSDIRTAVRHPASLMPEGLANWITPVAFADLIAYLESLRLPEEQAGTSPGPRKRIGLARQPLGFEPVLAPEVTFVRPVSLAGIPERPGSFVVFEESGKGWIARKGIGATAKVPFVDLSGVMPEGDPGAAPAIAFHPAFATNGRYFLLYRTRGVTTPAAMLVERRFHQDLGNDAGEESRVILEITEPAVPSTRGSLAFGPDGFLYLGIPAPRIPGADASAMTLAGKVLRLDIDRKDGGPGYGIPPDNPFVASEAFPPEIWASGFTQRAALGFDPLHGRLWVSDESRGGPQKVGIVRRGKDYAWTHDGVPDRPGGDGVPSFGPSRPPVFFYPDRLGSALAGGYPYRGIRSRAFRGDFICADAESRRVWAIAHQGDSVTRLTEIGLAPSTIGALALAEDGELYMAGRDNGILYRLVLERCDPGNRQIRPILPTSEGEGVLWRYTFDPPPDGWTAPDFDDSKWLEGPGGFGQLEAPGVVVRTPWGGSDIWLRRTFTFSPIDEAAGRTLHTRILHDDDCEVYLNGKQVYQLRGWLVEYRNYNLGGYLRPGQNSIAVHCRQEFGGQFIDVGIGETVNLFADDPSPPAPASPTEP